MTKGASIVVGTSCAKTSVRATPSNCSQTHAAKLFRRRSHGFCGRKASALDPGSGGDGLPLPAGPPGGPWPAPSALQQRLGLPGQRVHVLRSNGAVTLATVEHGYEMMFDTLYQVRTDDGLMKAAVAEEELSEAPDAPPDPWSGFTDFMMGEDDN